jgi:chemotaxis protein MotB
VRRAIPSSEKVQTAVGGYFKDPSGTSKLAGSAMQGSAENFVITKDNMPELKEQLEKAFREVPNFEKLKDNIDMTVTNKGSRIELTESAAGTFFDSGSARMSTDGKDLLLALGHELGNLPNKLALEGHTDSKQYSSGGTDGNWELSADRANAARRLMMQNEIRADQRLRKPDAPLDPANRRMSLIVQYQEKKTPAEGKSSEGEGKDGGKKWPKENPRKKKGKSRRSPQAKRRNLRRILANSSEIQDCDLVGMLVIGVRHAIAFRK